MKVVDMHCDTISEIWYSHSNENPKQLLKNDLHIDIDKMKKGDYFLQNFAMFIDLEKNRNPFSYIMNLIDIFYSEIEKNKNDIYVIKSYEDIIEAKEKGKMCAMLTAEEGECCEGKLENLYTLYDRGVRMMTLTWNHKNSLGGPNLYNSDGTIDGETRLTKTGIEFVEEMQRLGVIIDVSHLSDAGFYDVVNNSNKPFVASHSNARTLCYNRRNLTDEMIRIIAERGGVIGLNYYGEFLTEPDSDGKTPSRINDMVKHARHIINIGGRECIGLGSDFDGIDGELEMKNCTYLPQLAVELERQGFTNDEIEGIFYKNVLRVYKEML